MIVWVLVITTFGSSIYSSPSTIIIDNIATAESCRQLAKVISVDRQKAVTCAPVRKVVVK